LEPSSPTFSSTGTNLRLKGALIPLARAAFVVLSLSAIIFFSLGVPLDYQNYLTSIDAETQAALEQLHVTAGFYAAYQISLVILLAIGFGIAGLIIFRYKSDDWLAILVAFTLIGQGVNAFSPLSRLRGIPEFQIPVNFLVSMVLMGLPLSCYLFPDGKIQKRWMLYLAGIWFVWLMVSTFWPSFPVNLHRRGGNATLYSFGIMTFQMLTGKKPFEHNNTWAMIRAHLEEPPPDPRTIVPMPDAVAQAILKAVAKDPEDRFPSVGEFVREMRKPGSN
jgi:hypothetical protein